MVHRQILLSTFSLSRQKKTMLSLKLTEFAWLSVGVLHPQRHMPHSQLANAAHVNMDIVPPTATLVVQHWKWFSLNTCHCD